MWPCPSLKAFCLRIGSMIFLKFNRILTSTIMTFFWRSFRNVQCFFRKTISTFITLYLHAFVSIIDLTINDAKSDRDALVIQAALPMTMTTIKVYRRCQEFAPLRPSWNFRPRRLYCEASERRRTGGISYDNSAFFTTKPISCKNKAEWPF